APVAGNFLRRALQQHFALHQHRDAAREAEHQVHVVLDDQDRNFRGPLFQELQDPLGLRRRHARRRLVEQQHPGPQPERDRDLHQALLAVGEVDDGRSQVVGETQRGKQLRGFLYYFFVTPCSAPHARRHAAALGDGERDVVEHWKVAEQAVNLEGAAQAALHALRLRRPGHVVAAEQDAAGGGPQGPHQHVDEGGLAGAVRPDERVAVSGPQPEIDALRDCQRAEALAEPAGFQSNRHGLFPTLRRNLSINPKIPPRANSTTTTSSRPMPRYQYSGNCLASRSCATRWASGPMNAPYRRPTPPRISITSSSPEGSKPSTFRPTNWLVCVSSAPATPAITADRVYTPTSRQ